MGGAIPLKVSKLADILLCSHYVSVYVCDSAKPLFAAFKLSS
jgi:hypothetical protein